MAQITEAQKDAVVNQFNSGERRLGTIGRNNGIAWQSVWAILFDKGLVQQKPGRRGGPGMIGRKPVSVTVTEDMAVVETTDETADEEFTEPVKPPTNFVPPAWYPVLKYALTSEKGCTLFGPRGCGKSTAIRHLAGEVEHNTVTLQCAANMQIDSLLGSWTTENGSLRFIDGPLTIALRNGAWLIAEEANVIHPGVWSVVNTLTDQTGEGLRLPTGEVVRPHEGFRLILIYNEGYTGTREVNAALKDRLMPIYAGYLDADQEIKLLESMAGGTTEECRRVHDVAEMIRKADLHFDLSPRSLCRWIKLVKLGGFAWKDAYERAVMDLIGTPETAGPQRAVLTEIAANTIDQWN